MRFEINMMWNNVPRHYKKDFYLFLDHGITNCIFVMAWHDKNAIHAMTKLNVVKKLKVFFVNKKMLTLFTMIYMFVNYICTKFTFVQNTLMHTSIKD
jgi:hypothetical protein